MFCYGYEAGLFSKTDLDDLPQGFIFTTHLLMCNASHMVQHGKYIQNDMYFCIKAFTDLDTGYFKHNHIKSVNATS